MKKILIALVLGAVAYTGCKKKEGIVSQIVTVSIPVVTITGDQYFSMHVGDPLPTVTAVAYDTFYRDSLPVLVDYDGVDVTEPGLYAIKASAKNRNGHVGVSQVYIAVTEVSDLMDLTGWYSRLGVGARSARITKVGRGIYTTSNLGGVDTTDASTGAVISAVFAVTSDTTVSFGKQYVNNNGVSTLLHTASESLMLTPPDTVINYALDNFPGFGSQVRSFTKE